MDAPTEDPDVGSDLLASARGWQRLQLGVLGFIGLCGAIEGISGSWNPGWLQTVAGLLGGADVIQALQARASLGEIVILPRIMFDHPDGIALDDISPLDIARAINRPVALADWMGDVVDALTGRNKLLFDPAGDPLHVPIVREGGWAVEKYL